MTVHHKSLGDPLRRLEAMINRLILGILLAAFVVGMGLLMVAYHPAGDDSWLGWFFGAGLVAIVVLGIRLVLSVRRGGRR